jgi:Histidine kinase
MNTAAPELLPTPGMVARVRTTLIAWREAIATLGLGPWRWAALIALFGTILQCALILGERGSSVPTSELVRVCAGAAICWAVQVSLGLCAWAVVDRSGASQDQRARRLAIALLVVVLLQAALVPALIRVLVGHVDPCVVHGCEEKDWSKVPWWLMDTEAGGHMLIFGALLFAWLEVHHRNREIEQRLVASQQERARLLHAAFDSRLTAMQSQIDPQFLFDSLADVQAAYAADTSQGAAKLDRLIVYLRTALARLRSEGSTMGNESTDRDRR